MVCIENTDKDPEHRNINFGELFANPNCSYRIFVELSLGSIKLSWLFLELKAAKQYHGIPLFSFGSSFR